VRGIGKRAEKRKKGERGEETDQCSRDNQQREVKLPRKGARTTAIFKASSLSLPVNAGSQKTVS